MKRVTFLSTYWNEESDQFNDVDLFISLHKTTIRKYFKANPKYVEIVNSEGTSNLVTKYKGKDLLQVSILEIENDTIDKIHINVADTKFIINEAFKIATSSKIIIEEGVYAVRDKSLFESLPNQLFASAFGEFVYPSILDKAAFLMYSLAKNHIFTNGNKRTAVVATHMFLMELGIMFIEKEPNEDLFKKAYNFVIEIAQSQTSQQLETIRKIKMFIFKNSQLYVENE